MELDEGVVHIYAQHGHHDEARVVSTRRGLEQLRDAAQEAINEGRSEALALTADGEGYQIRFQRIDAEFGSDEWDQMTLPYVGIEYADCVGRGLYDYWTRQDDERRAQAREERSRWWSALKAIIVNAEDPAIIALAAGALNWSDKLVESARADKE